MLMTTWVTNHGQEMELPDDFEPSGLKAMGWKKKRGPKKQDPSPIPVEATEANDNG